MSKIQIKYKAKTNLLLSFSSFHYKIHVERTITSLIQDHWKLRLFKSMFHHRNQTKHDYHIIEKNFIIKYCKYFKIMSEIEMYFIVEKRV